MTQELQISIASSITENGKLIQTNATITDPNVDAAIAPQKAFFELVQRRAQALGAEVAKGRNRLGKGTKRLWAEDLLKQAVADMSSIDTSMGLTQDQRDRIDEATAAVAAARKAVTDLDDYFNQQGINKDV